ncbi:MAG: hypothetical protein CMF25_02975 [Kangiellaceae bacterium]|nr:hypothetical protein [Kangiellaceae bacterium]|tara:strand:+ start:251 stop:1276 length:1026 start_codon:yes stop_codon:yes gene_type:complete
MKNRYFEYDFIRASAIIVVFLAHVVMAQAPGTFQANVLGTISPGLTMSLLGFLSAILLNYHIAEPSAFLLKRLIRIFIPLGLCLTMVTLLHWAQGRHALTQDLLFHYMGLTAFFDLLGAKNHAIVGSGLWFITTIVGLYFSIPVLKGLLTHRNGAWHLLGLILLCTGFKLVMYNAQSIWNVVIAFSMGLYVREHQLLGRLKALPLWICLVGCAVVLTVLWMATIRSIPYAVRDVLYAFYPVFFFPLLLRMGALIPDIIQRPIQWFALISFEFYLLHFYFINHEFVRLFGSQPMWLMLLAGGVISLITAAILQPCGSWLCLRADDYLASKGDSAKTATKAAA